MNEESILQIGYLKDKSDTYLNDKLINNQTLLSRAILHKKLDIVEYLVNKRVNLNGITSTSGYSLSTPISLIPIQKFSIFKDYYNLLILNGANQNDYGIDLKTLLYNITASIDSINIKRSKKIIKYILSKGAEVNCNIYFSPLHSLLNNSNISEYRRKQLFFIFLSYEVDVNQIPLGINFEIPTFKRIVLDFRHELIYIPMIRYLANICKVPISNSLYSKSYRDFICSCIHLILDHIDDFLEIPTLNIYQLHQKDLYKSSQNSCTLLGTSIIEIPISHVVKFSKGNLWWIFHMSEIPYILQINKNPYTHENLSLEEKKYLLDSLEYVKDYSFEDIKILDRKRDIKYDRKHLFIVEAMNKFSFAFNPYLHLSCLNRLSKRELLFFLGNLEKEGIPLSRRYSKNQRSDSLVQIIYENLLIALVERNIPICILALVVEQPINDHYIIENIEVLIGYENFQTLSQMSVKFTQLKYVIETYFNLEESVYEQITLLLEKQAAFIDRYWDNIISKLIRPLD